jgi:hypothetical protein
MTMAKRADPVARLYRATTTPELVEVPALWFLCLDGHGDPNTAPQYAEAVEALFAVSYAAKFSVRRSGGTDFKVSPLEGLWTAEDLGTFLTGDKGDWDWTMMIRQPDSVSAEMVARLGEEAATRKGIVAANRLRLERFEEGPAAQVLHVGPYAEEGPTIARLHAFIHEHGFTFDGHVQRHHEIYLGDPRRAAPEKLRTLIRQPYAAP